ncbi:MerR family transcriptional regulator [Acidimicrobiaceae bacterium USS-CC1]|uniref:MerR family transcriptional regulator n=1 Tax=Acidiferrimicrobium australe TaxID=2664430 RepID=A0ABW9R0F5_9ACTN|nr:MerR family transcriptional regulator [Acidiferrimicrobium australe]
MLTIGDFARLGQVSPRMLRHYDEIDLLRPDRVDPVTGYRLYDVRQLGRLHRIVALRDMGFGLEQIAQVLSEEVSVDELRGMLRLRRAQIARTVEEEQGRLRRVEAHLRALEWSDTVELQDVVVKQTVPVRVARATATGLSHADIGAAFGRLLPRVLAHLEAAGVAPGLSVGVYEDQGGSVPEGELVLHAGFAIGDRDLPDGDDVHVVDLPVVEVAAATYRGPNDGIVAAWEALVRWVDDSGYRLVGDCRELYHEWDDTDPSRNVMELQQPIAR